MAIYFWLLNISSAFIDPVALCISQTRATARLTQRVVDHMLNRTGYFSQEILSPDKTIVDRFKSCWVFLFSLERDCVRVSALRVLCLLSCSHVQIQPTQFVPTVTRWILRATTADSHTGIKPINLATDICYNEGELRSESCFGLCLR